MASSFFGFLPPPLFFCCSGSAKRSRFLQRVNCSSVLELEGTLCGLGSALSWKAFYPWTSVLKVPFFQELTSLQLCQLFVVRQGLLIVVGVLLCFVFVFCLGFVTYLYRKVSQIQETQPLADVNPLFFWVSTHTMLLIPVCFGTFFFIWNPVPFITSCLYMAPSWSSPKSQCFEDFPFTSHPFW